MSRFFLFLISFLIAVNVPLQSQSVPDELTLEEIFHEPVIPGIRPSFYSFSGDQSEVFFSWNDSSYYKTGIYKFSLENMNYEEADEDTPRVIHSPNNLKFAYTNNGDLFIANADGTRQRKIIATQESDHSPVWSPNSLWIAFERSEDVWVANTLRTELIQVTRKKEDEPGFTIDSWAGNQRLVLRQSDYSDARTIYFPEYVDEFVEPGSSTRGIPKVNIFAASLDTTVLDTLLTDVHRSSTAASKTGNYIAIDYADAALKNREIILHDLRNETKTILFEDSTDGWLSNRSIEFAPFTDQLLFTSEQSGWNHLYITNASNSEFEQITSGEFEISWSEWIDNHSIVYANNEADYGERHIFAYDVQSKERQQLTTEEGYRYQFELSPDRSKLLYARTFFNQPYDFYMLNLDNPTREIQITSSVAEQFDDYDWQQEEYVRFTGRDGETELSMSVLYPENFESTDNRPVVVFVHGAGSLQNVYKGWSNNYWREYMFNQYLNKHGYVVIEVDYRHSTGYGREFREDVTNWMGKYETMDIVDGLDWVHENRGGIDLGNVGLYGGSYGGFMTLYALTDQPDRFHAGAALRKVSNWRNYYYANPLYTLPRLGDPEEVPENYDRSSPLTYAEDLEHPVLLLHGLVDDNVGFQDAAQYIDALIEAGHEDFGMMMYPSEAHGFTKPESWYDEYRRIFEFFEEHLK
jgi:dipeptidyl aminopeptidase/acylaminoacyl peptidase